MAAIQWEKGFWVLEQQPEGHYSEQPPRRTLVTETRLLFLSVSLSAVGSHGMMPPHTEYYSSI